MKFHLWWFIMYLSSMCYFNSNHCNGFILGSHLSDVYGPLSDYYFFFLYFTSLFLCAHVYVHMFICVWGGTWVYVYMEARRGRHWNSRNLKEYLACCVGTGIQTPVFSFAQCLKTWIISPASSSHAYGIIITIHFFTDVPYLSKTF